MSNQNSFCYIGYLGLFEKLWRPIQFSSFNSENHNFSRKKLLLNAVILSFSNTISKAYYYQWVSCKIFRKIVVCLNIYIFGAFINFTYLLNYTGIPTYLLQWLIYIFCGRLGWRQNITELYNFFTVLCTHFKF